LDAGVPTDFDRRNGIAGNQARGFHAEIAGHRLVCYFSRGSPGCGPARASGIFQHWIRPAMHLLLTILLIGVRQALFGAWAVVNGRWFPRSR